MTTLATGTQVRVRPPDLPTVQFTPPAPALRMQTPDRTLQLAAPAPTLRMRPPDPPGRFVVPIRGPQGPPGAPGGTYSHHQTTPAATWAVTHNLGRKPAVLLLPDDSPTQPVWTDVTYLDDNTLIIEWPAAVSGWAHF